ncbi:MAG TPA: YtxH domain-containing protein [Pyrinomonadaceae bacterium]|nr:YtxH domain-containing protein [Pyrinomonadaceae bacterium]
MNININDKLIYLGAGAGIGVVLGLLFAPKSGQEMRNDLGHRVDDLSHKVQDRIESSGIKDTATHTWQNVVEKGKNVASMGRRRFNESIEAGRTKFNESIEGEELSER